MRNTERNVIGFTGTSKATWNTGARWSLLVEKLLLQYTRNMALWVFLAVSKETSEIQGKEIRKYNSSRPL